MIGDLFKEKLHQIVGEKKGPLGLAYSSLKSRIAKIDEKMAKVVDTNSDEYRQLDMTRREAVLQVSNIWNRTATSIRHLVDFTIFGEERHNMKFWSEYMQAYEMDAEGLRLEMESLYPTKKPEEIGDILDAWNASINQSSAPNRMKNIVFNEVYRAWRKKHGIDTRHHLDPENLRNLSRGLVGQPIPKGWKGIDIDTRNVIDDIFDEDNISRQKTKKKFKPEGFIQDKKGGYKTNKSGEKIEKRAIKVPRPDKGRAKPKRGKEGKKRIELLDNFKVEDTDFLFSKKDVKETIEGPDAPLQKYPVISKLRKYK